MPNFFRQPWSFLSIVLWSTVGCVVVYIGLIAATMNYAALTIGYAQSVKDDEAVVAALESAYLAHVAAIETADYLSAGYVKPSRIVFVPARRATARR